MEKLLSQYLYNCQSFVKSLSLFVNFSPDLNDFFRILSLTPHEIKASLLEAYHFVILHFLIVLVEKHGFMVRT